MASVLLSRMNRAGCAYAAIIVSFSLCWKTTAALTWSDGAGFRRVDVHPESGRKAGFTLMDSTATGVGFTNVRQGDADLTNAVAHRPGAI